MRGVIRLLQTQGVYCYVCNNKFTGGGPKNIIRIDTEYGEKLSHPDCRGNYKPSDSLVG